MAVITISRGSFSGGKALAECLATELGLRCVDREVIVEKAAAVGVSQESLRAALNSPPTFWDRFTHKRYMYLTIIQAALCEEVSSGNAVYHGHAGHLLLQGVSHVLRTRIVAPMQFRASLVRERLKLNHQEAVAYIQRMDQDRARWTQYLYGVNWGDPILYDLVLNLESLDIPQACNIIAAAARQECFIETEASRVAMRDLVVASRVRATLALNDATQDLEVEVECRGAAVSIIGRLPRHAQLAEIEAIARQVPGVTSVDFNPYRAAQVPAPS